MEFITVDNNQFRISLKLYGIYTSIRSVIFISVNLQINRMVSEEYPFILRVWAALEVYIFCVAVKQGLAEESSDHHFTYVPSVQVARIFTMACSSVNAQERSWRLVL